MARLYERDLFWSTTCNDGGSKSYKGPGVMSFAKVDVCLIVEVFDQEGTVKKSHQFIDSFVLAGQPVFDSSITVTIVSDVENAHQLRLEFEQH